MTDITEKLRETWLPRYLKDAYMFVAADEIDRLRAQLAAMTEQAEQLREALVLLRGDGDVSGTWTEAVSAIVSRFGDTQRAKDFAGPLYADPQPSPVHGQSVVEVVARVIRDNLDLSSELLDELDLVLVAQAAIAVMNNATEKQIVAWLREGGHLPPERGLLISVLRNAASAIERGDHKQE